MKRLVIIYFDIKIMLKKYLYITKTKQCVVFEVYYLKNAVKQFAVRKITYFIIKCQNRKY